MRAGGSRLGAARPRIIVTVHGRLDSSRCRRLGARPRPDEGLERSSRRPAAARTTPAGVRPPAVFGLPSVYVYTKLGTGGLIGARRRKQLVGSGAEHDGIVGDTLCMCAKLNRDGAWGAETTAAQTVGENAKGPALPRRSPGALRRQRRSDPNVQPPRRRHPDRLVQPPRPRHPDRRSQIRGPNQHDQT